MAHGHLDLRSRLNSACCKCASDERQQKLDEGFCPDVVSVLDGLAVRCVGEWAYKKIYFLLQYFDIFSQGMKKHFAGKLNYVEICCGPGRCIIREQQEEIDGTSLAVVNHPNLRLLSSAVFLDRNPLAAEVLNLRIAQIGQQHRASAQVANYNDANQVVAALARIPRDGLSLVFIDPTDCSVPLATIRAVVTALGRADLIVTFPIGTDFNRNAVSAILHPEQFAVLRSKYESFLGSEEFFLNPEVIEAAKRKAHARLRDRFREQYRASLAQLGYQYFENRRVKHYYDILYATRHERGLDFWRKAQTYGPDNQKSLDFGR